MTTWQTQKKKEEEKKRYQEWFNFFIMIGFIVILALVGVLKIINIQDAYLNVKHNNYTTSKVDFNDEDKIDYEKVKKFEEKKLFQNNILSFYDQQKELFKKAGLSPKDIDKKTWGYLILSVQHEVGTDEKNFPGYDFDQIQQYMAKSIYNRLKSPLYPNDIIEVLSEYNQYPDLLNDLRYETYNINDQRTALNCLKVMINMEDFRIPENMYFELSFPYNSDNSSEVSVTNQEEAMEQIYSMNISTEIYGCFSAIYSPPDSPQRLIIFCGSQSGPY